MKKIIAMILAVLLCSMSVISALSDGAERKILNIGAFSFSVDQNRHLKVTFSPNNDREMEISWDAAASELATEIRVGLLSAGISARPDENNATAISVSLFRQPAVTAVTLSRSSIIMMGQPVKITAVCEPEGSSQEVVWTSSNPNVAAVDPDGTVTPKGYGTCRITAESANGLSASCSVAVNKSNTVTKHFTWGEEWPFLIQDTFTLEVDGLTGQIVSYDAQQYSQDMGGLRLISNDGIQVTDVQKDYVEFQSTYSVKVGISGKRLNVSMSLLSSTCSFRMDNQGNLRKISGSNSELMDWCR